MTSHVLYADRTATARVAPSAPVSFVRQVLDLVKAVYADPAAASESNHPWLTATIRSHMSNRAHRLMRSDY
ncbi:MAG: hypothetical protein RLZZ296_925 [Pseudomonadota bacterium]|jgi:hypothetical protein